MERHRLASVLSITLAIGIIAAGILGPLLVAAGWLWLRDGRMAPALAFGPAAYAGSPFVTAILVQEYALYDGNVERAFPLYGAFVALGAAVAVLAASQLVQQPAPLPGDRLRTAVAGIFLLIAAFFALARIGQVLQVYRGEKPAGYVDEPTLFWLIKMLDLGFLLPALGAIGIGLLRRSELAVRIVYGMLPYAVCMAGAVPGMGITMWLGDDPAASVPMIAFLAPITIGLGLVAAIMLMRYRQRDDRLVIDTTTFGTGHAG